MADLIAREDIDTAIEASTELDLSPLGSLPEVPVRESVKESRADDPRATVDV